jgi:hypothetical protein
MYSFRALSLCVSLGALTAMGSSAIAGQYYRGYAYTAADHRLLYTESHWLYDDHGVGRRLVIYACPAGQREVFVQNDGNSAEKHAALTVPPNAVIDAGFDAFVREHWDTLSGPGVAPLPFLILSDLHFVDFSARKLRDEQAGDGHGIRWFRLQLAGWYAFVLPHIDVAYDQQTHELFEYTGLSNIRGAGNRNLTVTIQFPPTDRRADVSEADVQRATQAPLTGRCASS